MFHKNGRLNSGKKAVLRYLAGDIEIIESGDYVTCAVTGQFIPLHKLCYWSTALQEPYASPEASLARYRSIRTEDGSMG